MSTYADTDRCTDILLDHLISPGESGGNYNAVIGNIHATDELSRYTIRQIYQLQDAALARGNPSTAIGRYQFLKRTLQDIIGEVYANENSLFTQELQDRLCVQLLIGRAYRSWWNGEIGDLTLLHNLSCEWASLPDPRNGGRSHYDAIAGNHAGMTQQHAMSVILAARNTRLRSAPSALSPATVATVAPPISRTVAEGTMFGFERDGGGNLKVAGT